MSLQSCRLWTKAWTTSLKAADSRCGRLQNKKTQLTTENDGSEPRTCLHWNWIHHTMLNTLCCRRMRRILWTFVLDVHLQMLKNPPQICKNASSTGVRGHRGGNTDSQLGCEESKLPVCMTKCTVCVNTWTQTSDLVRLWGNSSSWVWNTVIHHKSRCSPTWRNKELIQAARLSFPSTPPTPLLMRVFVSKMSGGFLKHPSLSVLLTQLTEQTQTTGPLWTRGWETDTLEPGC